MPVPRLDHGALDSAEFGARLSRTIPGLLRFRLRTSAELKHLAQQARAGRSQLTSERMRETHCCIATSGLLLPPARRYLSVRKRRIPGRSARTTKGWSMFLAKLIRLYRSWRTYERSMSELNRLDDRELADIGISRAEIAAVAWGERHR